MYLHVRWILSSGCKLLSLDYSRRMRRLCWNKPPSIYSHLRFSRDSLKWAFQACSKISPSCQMQKPEEFPARTTLFDPPGCIFEALSALFDSDHDFQLYAVLSSDSKEAGDVACRDLVVGRWWGGSKSPTGHLRRIQEEWTEDAETVRSYSKEFNNLEGITEDRSLEKSSSPFRLFSLFFLPCVEAASSDLH